MATVVANVGYTPVIVRVITPVVPADNGLLKLLPLLVSGWGPTSKDTAPVHELDP